MERAKTIKQMKKLNEMNWQYMVVAFSLLDHKVSINHLPDFECIQIANRRTEIRKKPSSSKLIDMVAIGLKANLYSMVGKNLKKGIKILRRAQNNNRMQRYRPESQQKNSALTVYAPRNKDGLASAFG